MKSLFLDTGFLIALESIDDQYHKSAQEYWQSFRTVQSTLVTTSYVFDEITTFFNSRGYHQKAVETGKTLLISPSIEFIHVTNQLFDAGWKTFQHYPDKRYSLTDCISFEVMKNKSIGEVLSFDHHFEQAGFIMYP